MILKWIEVIIIGLKKCLICFVVYVVVDLVGVVDEDGKIRVVLF